MARTTSSPSLAPRLPMTSEAPALAIAKAVALPMPVPPPVTMPTLLAKDAISPPEQHGHDQASSSLHRTHPRETRAIASVESLVGSTATAANAAANTTSGLDAEPT